MACLGANYPEETEKWEGGSLTAGGIFQYYRLNALIMRFIV